MHSLVRHLIRWLIHLGALGLVVMGILDSSFLFLPLGNDLLMVALTVQKHDRLPLYAAMAAVGSIAGLNERLPIMQPIRRIQPIAANHAVYDDTYKEYRQFYDMLYKK